VALLMRTDLRKALRAARRSIPHHERLRAARAVAQHADKAFNLHAGQRIALYASLPEELDTSPLAALTRERGCEIYLPRINPRAPTMRFIAAAGGLQTNRLGIEEPQGSRYIGARWLDLVFLPLVGFDARGMRLGMGGGYYDRAFAFRHLRKSWRGPRLVGLAFALQQAPSIPSETHDVHLDAVVTEAGCLFF
jgi:5-formyltetrahydrofolate cyclo-ligase